MLRLRSPIVADADVLYGHLENSRVTDTIVWDGPASIDELRKGLAERTNPAPGTRFYIIEWHGEAVGACDLRREPDGLGTGLWIAESVQGQGIGTQVVRRLTDIAFADLEADKVQAGVFVNNWASRRIFEKAGYRYTETVERAVCKRGFWIDEWLLIATRGNVDGGA